jgi:hypothetical protein
LEVGLIPRGRRGISTCSPLSKCELLTSLLSHGARISGGGLFLMSVQLKAIVLFKALLRHQAEIIDRAAIELRKRNDWLSTWVPTPCMK